ncbi:TPA: type 1 fimbrial protein, partial [Escherichia coli]|nr:type 1 fimbrial protein [Escherichia coli]
MKKTIMSLAVVSALFSAGAMAALTNGQADNSASTANLNFTGKVTSSLCQINTNDLNKTIQLGNASVSELSGTGQSPYISFQVGLVNCDPEVANINYVISDGNNSPATGATSSYLVPKSSSTSASGVGVYIADSEHKAIQIGENKSLTVIKGVDTKALSEQTVSLTAYMKKAEGANAVTAGTVEATGVMTIKANAAT